jgi:hypothetical protein
MQCNSIPQKTTHQFEMSSSSSSVSAKTSSRVPVPVGTRKFPDGFVGPADMPFCKVCYDAGLPVADYTDHFVKDQPGPNGKVVCPTLLAQKCLTCGLHGHTSSYCPGTIRREQERVGREQLKKANGGWETVGAKGTASYSSSVSSKPRIEDMVPKKSANLKPVHQRGAVAAPATSTKYGSFGALAVDDSSSDEELLHEVAQLPAGVPKPVRKEAVVVTGPPPAVAPPKPLTWAQRAAAAAQKPSPPSSSSSSSAAAPLNDTRFQLHAMCDNIEQSKRASATKKVNHVAPAHGPVAETANIRGAAAAVASESSKKRKQNSAMIPA